jgi:putative membrane-bound dehydrogenase-like protein
MEFRAIVYAVMLLTACTLLARIPKPGDAPRPLSPMLSAGQVRLPAGFKLELVAAEPLIRQPTGVCWDANGQLFVCELHGYNLEGQFDIEELNKTGELDRVVRRLPAPSEAQRKAKEAQHGVVKRLKDIDGDGRMDKADVWADDLPPCLGIVPAGDGVIVTAEPDVIFLADRDGDGKAEIRETLFTGFKVGMLERRINQPKWGPDGWIYAGRGHGGRITGPRLAKPVQLPGSDFRFRPDGSAIEPVTGGTSTIGWTFTGTGHRFTATTVAPGIFIAPIPWHYLTRNPKVAIRGVGQRAAGYQKIHQISKPHPWRTRREKDPGFFKYYNQRYGDSESIAAGYFTAACSPLVYRDNALPGLKGNYLVCEPATNIVHRAIIQQDGTFLRLERHPQEPKTEFLASRDTWFHPISLTHDPGGAIAIVDFYREIIEDYSAIPRYLQQQYELDHGKDHGRIWRLVHKDMPKPPDPDMAKLDAVGLAKETGSPYHWRRETARRLLVERATLSPDAIRIMEKLAANSTNNRETVTNALHTLSGLDRISPSPLLSSLNHADFGVRVHALRHSEPWIDRSQQVLDKVVSMTGDANALVLLQLALTLGESNSGEARKALELLVKDHAGIRWMKEAVASSRSLREGGEVKLDPKNLASLREAAKQVTTEKHPVADDDFDRNYKRYVSALRGKRNVSRGEKLFQETCAACHKVRGIGRAVGPDLTGERNRAEETLVLDILAPSREITAGYAAHVIQTREGHSLAGLLVSEAPGNVILRDLSGTEHIIPRKSIAKLESIQTSLMPADLSQILSPKDMADIIAWFRQ